MRALETRYRGHRFRSRLEARWAVFFDYLRIRWEYKINGYPVQGGGGYLPDFWLPQLDCWVEIKPPGPVRGTDQRKVLSLATASGKPVYLFRGAVELRAQRAVGGALEIHDAQHVFPGAYWTECPYCGEVGIALRARIDYLRCGCARQAGLTSPVSRWLTPRLLSA